MCSLERGVFIRIECVLYTMGALKRARARGALSLSLSLSLSVALSLSLSLPPALL
jgi:hypothetical protein